MPLLIKRILEQWMYVGVVGKLEQLFFMCVGVVKGNVFLENDS